MIKWLKIYYWNVKYDMPRNMERSLRDKFRYLFLFPYYTILAFFARAGFLDTQEGSWMRLKDFTPFFWRTLIKRAVAQERRSWEYQLLGKDRLIEQARREAQEEVWDYLEQKIDQDFGQR